MQGNGGGDLYYKLVATDIDGTLLDSRAQIRAETAEAVREFRERGGVFMLATGRSVHSSVEFADALGLDGPIISFNGGKVSDLKTGETVYETFLDPAKAREAFAALRAIGKDVIAYRDAQPYAADSTPVTDKYGRRIKMDVVIDHDMTEAIDERTKKLLVIDPKQEFERILDVLRPVFGDEINTVCSDAEYLEVLPPGTSKGQGLEAAAKWLGVPMSQTVAIGDHLNDISMIKAAGLGVAVANAMHELKDAAGYVTASNDDDGVGKLLRRVMAGGKLP